MTIRFAKPIVLSISAVVLSACGEGEDAIIGSISNSITISNFDSSTNAVARIDRNYSTGKREVAVTNVIGNYNAQNVDNLDNSVVIANNFEGLLEDRYIEVEGRTVKRPVYEINSNNRFEYQTSYRALSLTGVDAQDYRPSNTINSSRGIFTDLNRYTAIPSNIRFPNGSICYVPVTSSARSFLQFNSKDRTSYQNLNSWVNATERRFSDNRAFTTTRFGSGINNRRNVAQVQFFAFNNEPEYLYNGVDYNNDIYEAKFVSNVQTQPNEDSIRGVVDCTLVNDVAADFLEREIRRYY